MAFLIFKNEKIPSSSKPEQAPIFIFPGILGNGFEVNALAQELAELYPSRPIYIYYEPQNKIVDGPLGDQPTLGTKIEEIAKEMQELFTADQEYHICPFIIVGYSFGATLAALTAKYLKQQGEDALVYLIDGIAPDYSKTFFNDKSKTNAVTSNFVDIINYAVKLSLGQNVMLTYDKLELDDLSKQDIISRIDNLSNLVLNTQQNNIFDAEQITAFKIYVERIKRNIQDLLLYTNDITTGSLLIIKTLFTQNTLSLYSSLKNDLSAGMAPHDPFGGWAPYATTIENDSSLADQTHLDLLMQENAERIALSIDQFIDQYMLQIIVRRQVQLTIEQIQIENKDGKFNDALLKLSKIANVIGTPSLHQELENENQLTVENLNDPFILTTNKKLLSKSEKHTFFMSQPQLSLKNQQNIFRDEYKNKAKP
jgi:thioesterase domain-containing protein